MHQNYGKYKSINLWSNHFSTASQCHNSQKHPFLWSAAVWWAEGWGEGCCWWTEDGDASSWHLSLSPRVKKRSHWAFSWESTVTVNNQLDCPSASLYRQGQHRSSSVPTLGAAPLGQQLLTADGFCSTAARGRTAGTVGVCDVDHFFIETQGSPINSISDWPEDLCVNVWSYSQFLFLIHEPFFGLHCIS